MRAIVTRIIVSTISLYFTRHKIIIRIKSNVFCICGYNGRYYTLPYLSIYVWQNVVSLWVCVHVNGASRVLTKMGLDTLKVHTQSNK